jgi:glycosyltransferase involved in cell wall biosynthesis
MPLVSVILPTRDRPELLPRAVESVLRQRHAELEVIIIDNNQRTPSVRTTPGSWPAPAEPRVRIIECRAATNASMARNAGLREARGEWVTYLDDDDAYHPEKIHDQLTLSGKTGAKLVLCGYAVVLPRRRRVRQTQVTGFSGDALLLEANWGTPLLFHRRDDALRFPESLAAGHDTVFAHQFLRKHDISIVPNCACSLVEVFPQIGAERVHADGEAIWRSHEMVRELMGERFTPRAWRAFMATGALVRAQFGYGSFRHFLSCAAAAAVTGGPKNWRLIANATARRFGWFKRWVVS